MRIAEGCAFCKLAHGELHSHVVHECADLIAFLVLSPIRESHCLILPKHHYDYFEDLPPPLSHRIVDLGQVIGRVQKRLYSAPRAGFLYTGGDIAHVHAHVLPLFTNKDITSMHYIKDKTVQFEPPPDLAWDELSSVAEKLRAGLKNASS